MVVLLVVTKDALVVFCLRTDNQSRQRMRYQQQREDRVLFSRDRRGHTIQKGNKEPIVPRTRQSQTQQTTAGRITRKTPHTRAETVAQQRLLVPQRKKNESEKEKSHRLPRTSNKKELPDEINKTAMSGRAWDVGRSSNHHHNGIRKARPRSKSGSMPPLMGETLPSKLGKYEHEGQ